MRPESRPDRGATIPLVALVLPVLILCTSFAVDLGRQRNAARDAQADADIISLDLVRLADGRTLDDIFSGTNSPLLSDAGAPLDAATALAESAARNDIDPAKITVDWGRVDLNGVFTSMLSDFTNTPSAVEVRVDDSVDFFFQPGDGDVTRSAVASTEIEPRAGFSIGSYGASLDSAQAGLLNGLISPILGNPASLDVLSYQGLADADLDVFDLGAELGLLSPSEVLTTEVPVADAMLAAADVLQRDGDAANAQLLRDSITAEVTSLPPITLGDIVSADQGGQDEALRTDLNALDLVSTAAFLSQCTPTATTVDDCSSLNLPNVNVSLPLLASTGAVRVVQSPQYHYGAIGTGTSTNQTRVQLALDVGAQEVGTCVPSLLNAFCLLGGLLVGTVDATVSIDATVTLAGGQATIAAIECPDPTALGLDLTATTSLYSVDLAVDIEFGRRGVLGGLLGPTLGSLSLVGTASQTDPAGTVSFTVAPDVFGETVRSVGAGSVGLSPVALTVAGGSGVLGTLGDLGITNTVGPLLDALVNPLLGELDTNVLGPLTDALGIDVVGADLTPERIDCLASEIRLVG